MSGPVTSAFPPEGTPPPARLTVEDVAKLWSIDPKKVRKWCTSGARIKGKLIYLNHVAAGADFRFSPEHLVEFDEACKRARRGEPFVPPPTPNEAAAQRRAQEFLAKRGRKPAENNPAPAPAPPIATPQPPSTSSPLPSGPEQAPASDPRLAAPRSTAAKPSSRKNRGGRSYKAGAIRPVPAMKKHKSGRARVRWCEGGVRHEKWFGRWGSSEAAKAYQAFVAQWVNDQGGEKPEEPPTTPLDVTGLCERFLAWAKGPEGHQKDGKVTSEYYLYDSACTEWVNLYGQLQVADMKAHHLRTLRQKWVAKGLARKTCNRYASKIIRVIRWGAGRDLVPAAILGPLREVEPLVSGKTTAPDLEPIQSVPWSTIEATLPHLHPEEGRRALLETAIRVQVLGRMRPSELIAMKPEHIDRSQTPWRYAVGKANKLRHKGKRRVVYFGPQARALLEPLLNGTEPGQSLWRFPVLRAGKRTTLTRLEYGRWIEKACVRAGVEHWTPNQLRHRGATDVHERYESSADVAAALGNSPEVARAVYIDFPEDRVAKRIAEATG